MPTSVLELKTVRTNVRSLVEGTLADTGGLLRLAPCWVPRSFLQPGKRLKLHPDDLYAFGLNRGGIDERWFASTTPAANDNRTPDEGLSYVVIGGKRLTLQQAVAECGATLIGSAIWKKYKKWPVYSKFFDNMGPIPHHMHQSAAQAKLVGQRPGQGIRRRGLPAGIPGDQADDRAAVQGAGAGGPLRRGREVKDAGGDLSGRQQIDGEIRSDQKVRFGNACYCRGKLLQSKCCRAPNQS